MSFRLGASAALPPDGLAGPGRSQVDELRIGKVRMTCYHKGATGASAQTGFGWDLGVGESL